MHVVIMGCGRVGAALAQNLAALDHSVAVIDQNPEAFRRLGPDFDGQSVTGVGYDRAVLTESGINRADAFAAVSSGDNSNIIAARVAREVYHVGTVVARIYDSQRASVYERLGIPTVATVRWTADRFMRHLLPAEQTPLWRDPTASVSLVEVRPHQEWIGSRLSRLEAAVGTRVAYLMRFGYGTLPTDSTVLQDGDQLFMLVTDDIVDTVRAVAGSAPEGQADR
ncbi:trk system potassium uptake protein TrkA [Stackebrandtia albiflava]|uniref:Trk system potassium uptake protein TrkA n=1 Tax=Stackebrandtia albiflava TaxID=406432 RepID=A0A562VBG6_9ACTN|nr:TrkA family potassium uptake protein [Stackebrandtia albiflava]TWJ15200.1 trk system potassium uptake protein TrkA [Stackebrandtia albiflava]